MSPETAYSILHLPFNASETDIRRAWRRRAKECHPDRPEGDIREFMELKAAYETLLPKSEKLRIRKTARARRWFGNG